MAVPKKRHSHSRTRWRRSHDALTKSNVIKCTDCGEPTLPHRVCPNCFRYKGKLVIETEA